MRETNVFCVFRGGKHLKIFCGAKTSPNNYGGSNPLLPAYLHVVLKSLQSVKTSYCIWETHNTNIINIISTYFLFFSTKIERYPVTDARVFPLQKFISQASYPPVLTAPTPLMRKAAKLKFLFIIKFMERVVT